MDKYRLSSDFLDSLSSVEIQKLFEAKPGIRIKGESSGYQRVHFDFSFAGVNIGYAWFDANTDIKWVLIKHFFPHYVAERLPDYGLKGRGIGALAYLGAANGLRSGFEVEGDSIVNLDRKKTKDMEAFLKRLKINPRMTLDETMQRAREYAVNKGFIGLDTQGNLDYNYKALC